MLTNITKSQIQDPAYNQGVKAYKCGIDEEACPYAKKQSKRASWYCGYFTARTADRLSDVFRIMDVDWFKEYAE